MLLIATDYYYSTIPDILVQLVMPCMFYNSGLSSQQSFTDLISDLVLTVQPISKIHSCTMDVATYANLDGNTVDILETMVESLGTSGKALLFYEDGEHGEHGEHGTAQKITVN